MRFINLATKKFGRWTVLEQNPIKIRNKIQWICQCECGTIRSVSGNDLRTGHSNSCGCLKAEVTGARRRTHGKSRTRAYGIWCGMKDRCYNPKSAGFESYMNRGIKVCDQWLNNFEQFLSDMGEPPPGYSIDRINNDGNYEPSNCQWKTPEEQSQNQQRTVRVSFNDEIISLRKAARLLGINYGIAWNMMNQNGRVQQMIDAEKAITFKSAGFYSWPH